MKVIRFSALWAALLSHFTSAQPDPPAQFPLDPASISKSHLKPIVPQEVCKGGVTWTPRLQVTSGFLEPLDQLFFADINGDGKDDYLTVSPKGVVKVWINKGYDSNMKITVTSL